MRGLSDAMSTRNRLLVRVQWPSLICALLEPRPHAQKRSALGSKMQRILVYTIRLHTLCGLR